MEQELFTLRVMEQKIVRFTKTIPATKIRATYLCSKKENGTAHFLTERHIKEFLEDSKCLLDFVFVASCHSEKAGKTFHRAGAKHVICIREDEKISDEAQIEFSIKFYEIIFSQT